MIVRAVEPWDAAAIVVQRGQDAEGLLDRAMMQDGPTFTIEADSGRILLIGGLTEVHRGHAIAWSVLAAGQHGDTLAAVTDATRAVIHTSGYRRVSTLVRCAFRPAHRWALRLGFEREGIMRAYGPDGSDYAVYAYLGTD